MKILIFSHRFFPDIGGIETVSLILARAFSAAGHEVIVLTRTGRGGECQGDVAIERNVSHIRLLEAVRWCDIYFQNNLSLRYIWPILLIPRRLVVTTQTWLDHGRSRRDFVVLTKRWMLRFAANVFISRAIAVHVGLPGHTIPNPYDARIFRKQSSSERRGDLVFVGRLVDDKGVDILLRSLAQLRAEDGIMPTLTIVGEGPEETPLKRLSEELNLGAGVSFLGSLQGQELARLLNRNRILVVPSRWAEPFGIVALEAIACGCIVVGSRSGGLPEAMGAGGITFENGSVESLAGALRRALALNGGTAELSDILVTNHLSRHTPETVAKAYLDLFRQLAH